MRSQVVIIGGGPAGLMLSQILMQKGIDTVLLERRSRDYVLSRIRAGVIEWGAVELLDKAGVGTRMHAEGIVHDGCEIALNGESLRIDFRALTGSAVMVYGQTEITRDLYEAQDKQGATIIHGAEDVSINDIDATSPWVTYQKDGQTHRIDCDFIAGCDGFYGVSRQAIPKAVQRDFEKVYPFGWLGILSETPPVAEELIYSRSERGFALASMRGPHLSRHYIQVPLGDSIEDWSDAHFWEEYKRRLPEKAAQDLVTGDSIEKSIAPLRSFVSEPMQWGKLFLCGDAAHIVPPTGAKGLNLAASDVHYLSRALIAHYCDKDDEHLANYGSDALARVWQAMRFSWSMTMMLHNFPELPEFDQRVQEVELTYLMQSETARRNLAENYVGLPY